MTSMDFYEGELKLERTVQNHSLYRKCNGKLYYVMGQAEHTETYEDMVIYHALYGEGETFVQPKEIFLSFAPEGKENKTGQKYLFELID